MKYITLLFLFISTSLFAQNNWQVLETNEYSISYPQDWVSSDMLTQPSMQFLLLSPEESQKNDKFRENINLTVEALGTNAMSLEDYIKLSTDQVIAQIPSAKILSNSTKKINNILAADIQWSADFGNGIALQFKQLFTIQNGVAYVLTYSSTEAEFNEYFDVANTIMNSFTFKN